jgi:hypothetical protein
MFGIQHKISLTRTTNTRALIRAAGNTASYGSYIALTAAVADAAINITKLRWAMPYIIPSIEEQSKFIQIINDRIPAPLTFLNKKSDYIAVPAATTFTWKLQLTSDIERVRYIVVGFQTGRGVNQITNSATFDVGVNLNVISAYVMLNGIRYPYSDVSTNITTNVYTKWYYNYVEFFNRYNSDKQGEPCLNYIEYLANAPLYVFDVSNQPEKLKHSTIDTQLQMTFALAAPANTIAYVVMYYDSIFTLTGDNNKQLIQLT